MEQVTDDKAIERERYEARGQQVLASAVHPPVDGAASLKPVLRAPYTHYENALRTLLRSGLSVLELGAGMGEHTGVLLRSGAAVTCLDIAPAALSTIDRRFAGETNRPNTVLGDIEALPFPSASIDIIACAGALSYGDPRQVNREIFRVLRPGGSLVCVDSLNHNWIYRLNRWRHFIRGERSRSTLLRIPTLNRLQSLSAPFSTVDISYFGALTWALAIIEPLVGPEAAASISDRLDAAVSVRRSAFKFVLVARNYHPG
jgi:SAM-dependent methyltransferase